MKFEDVTLLTKEVVAELMGTDYMEQNGYIEAIPMEKLVDVGVDVLNASSTENIFKKLVTRLSRYIIINNKAVKEVPSLFMTNDDFGGAISFIESDLADVFVDDMFNLVDGADYSTKEHTYYQPKIYTTYFKEAKTGLIALSKNEDALKEAFTSYDEMSSFLSAINSIISETLDEIMNAYMHALVSCAIAISDCGTGTSIDLGTMAIADGVIDAIPTDESALLNDANFMTYALMKIKEIRDNFNDRTSCYNDGSKSVRCADNNLILLNKFDNASRFVVKPNTYNVDMLNIGDYDKMNCWQSMKDSNDNTYDFETVSKIMLSADATNKLGIGTNAVTVTNCIGVLYDRYAMGISKKFTKTTSSYTGVGDFYNVFTHYLINLFINKRRNIVAFTLN